MKKYQIVFIIPNSRWHDKRCFKIIPYSALILTALLKNDFAFHIIDANGYNLSKNQVLSKLEELKPAAVLVSGASAEYFQQCNTLFSLAKAYDSECITVLGGVYPTVMENEALNNSNVDYIFMGHAEDRINDFLNMVLEHDFKALKQFSGIGFKNNAGKPVINPVKSYVSDVEKMVQPDYSLINVSQYLTQNTHVWNIDSRLPTATIVTTYGCPYNCVFCATRTISGRKIVIRPLKDVIKEIEYLIYTHGVKDLTFLDDNISHDKKHFTALLNTFIDRKYNITWKAACMSVWDLDNELLELMKKSGCTRICISVESGSRKVLKKIIRKPVNLEMVPDIVKKCKELNLELLSNFVIGFPGETWDDLRETVKYAEACDFDIVHFHLATPLPKTDLYKIAKDQGLLPDDFSFTDPKYCGWGQGFITTKDFSPFELMVLRAFEWDRINFSTPEKISKIADIYCMSDEELADHRKQTRLKLGIHF